MLGEYMGDCLVLTTSSCIYVVSALLFLHFHLLFHVLFYLFSSLLFFSDTVLIAGPPGGFVKEDYLRIEHGIEISFRKQTSSGMVRNNAGACHFSRLCHLLAERKVAEYVFPHI